LYERTHCSEGWSMLSVLQSVFIVVGTVVLSLVFLSVLRRVWPVTRRTEHNDIIGWQISVLGTTYAVILGVHALERLE
jgi:hypothetical protein